MTARSDLIAAATVGSANRSIDLAALNEHVRPDPIAADPALALLQAAVLSALARRTVPPTLPDATDAPIVPAFEKLPVMPNVIRQVLSRVTNQPAILTEALTLIHRAGFRLPPDLVPGLLDDTRAEVVAATRPAAGDIGRLLMARNPRWAEPPATNPAERAGWDEGTSAQRTTWLRALRRVEPAAARNLLAESFSGESAGNRAEFLTVLADGLSGEDQDFLLSAAGDRSPVVVAAAIALLTGLPDSPLRQDMRTLAARHLTLQRRLLRTTVTVTDPSATDFGRWPLPGGDPWTVLLSRVDPAEWPLIFGGDLLRLIAGGSEELYPLRPGFRRAAITFRHAGLARVLITDMFTRFGRQSPPVADGPLWAVLSPPDATALLDRLLTHPLTAPDQVATAVSALSSPWPAALARRFAYWLPTGGRAGAPAPRPLWDLLATATALPDCRDLAEFVRTLATHATGNHGSALTTRVGNAANLLTLRAVLHETLDAGGKL